MYFVPKTSDCVVNRRVLLGDSTELLINDLQALTEEVRQLKEVRDFDRKLLGSKSPPTL